MSGSRLQAWVAAMAAGLAVAVLLLLALRTAAGSSLAAPSTHAPPGTAGVISPLTSVVPTTTTTTTAPTTTAPNTTAPPTTAPQAPAGVGVVIMDFSDSSRSLDGAPRPLTTVVRYPSTAGAGQGEVPGAPPVGGRHPLIVFSHGYDTSPSTYAGLLDAWTRAGYVVAAPVFPLTSDQSPSLDEEDIVNQPADVSFVIDSILAANRSGSGRLAGLVEPGEIGVAGHSDGGETTAAVAFDTCCRDTRIKAALVVAGAELKIGSGTYFPSGSPPLMVVQGSEDDVNVVALSQQLYGDDPGPKYLMLLPGGTHLSGVTGDGPEVPVVEAATVDFFDAELRHRPGAPAALLADGNVAGVASTVGANQP